MSRIVETKYVDEQDSSSLAIERINVGDDENETILYRFTAENSTSIVLVDLTKSDVDLFLVDLADVAGIVEQKRKTRPCGCVTDERGAPPLCVAATGDAEQTYYCALPLGHARTHQFNRRY